MAPFSIFPYLEYFHTLCQKLSRILDFCYTYLEDILIFSPSWEEHVNHLSLVFQRLKKADPKIKLSKCQSFKQSLHYLGHAILDEGIRPLSENTEAIEALSLPTNTNEVLHFLRFTGYYNISVPLYADMAKHLNNSLHKKTPFVWSEECQSFFFNY